MVLQFAALMRQNESVYVAQYVGGLRNIHRQCVSSSIMC